ncbi:hypothetical protein [Rhizobium etli]|uniref:hypothetical protein n=1 Tax=Rhizobium etli TaxID=29449 RepID=UPI0012DB2EA7|nr:hypothetical protein [Rhizobium etli]
MKSAGFSLIHWFGPRKNFSEEIKNLNEVLECIDEYPRRKCIAEGVPEGRLRFDGPSTDRNIGERPGGQTIPMLQISQLTYGGQLPVPPVVGLPFAPSIRSGAVCCSAG